MESDIKLTEIKIRVDFNTGDIKEGECLSWDELLDKYDEVYYELDKLKEEYEEYQRNIEENYRRIPLSEQI